jgi:hypothetical protein
VPIHERGKRFAIALYESGDKFCVVVTHMCHAHFINTFLAAPSEGGE